MIAALVGLPEVAGYTLLDPWFLLLVPVGIAAAVWRRWRSRAALPAAATGLFAGLPTTLRARCVHLPLWLLCLSACLLALALARPVRREVLPQREQGIDIVLAVDISSSMQMQDMGDGDRVRRVDAARTRARAFAAGRTRDRVAFVAFARYAELRCPPTLDERALDAFLGALDALPVQSEIDGTATGVAVAKAVSVLQSSKAASRVVVLLTDGETTVDTIAVDDAIKLASDAKVRVHTIGIGRGQPMFDRFVPLDFRDLKAIAARTGGQFFTAPTDGDLAKVYAEIDALEKTELEDPRYRFVDGFAWPLSCGLLLLALSLLLEVGWIRGVP